jgi:F-type H+-transporting ATPase subunit epsilon
MAAAFDVFMVTPEREVWRGQATIVIARGSEGELGIMNGHVPLLIQLGIGPMFIEQVDGPRLAAAVDGGFLHVVTSNGETRVDVMADSAELREEIDLERVRAAKAEAERRLAADREDAEAQAELARAETRLTLMA